MSLFSDTLKEGFEATETDFGTVALTYNGSSINGTVSVLNDGINVEAGGIERESELTFTTTGTRFLTLFQSTVSAYHKLVTISGRQWRIEQVQYAPVTNIILKAPESTR